MREGKIAVNGGKVWFGIEGEKSKGVPLLSLHGGPGASHDYLLPLAKLSNTRPVVFYDQLGGGDSERPDDKSLWIVDRFVEELHIVRTELGLKSLNLLGQSWGAALAISYLGKYGEEGVKSLILTAPYLDTKLWEKDAAHYLSEMPSTLQNNIRTAENKKEFSSTDYQEAIMEYYKRHICRLDPWPEELNRTFEKINLDVYQYMWGPSEFTVLGTLKEFSVLPILRKLNLPVLFTAGEYDEATPEAVKYFQSITNNSRTKIFPDSSHQHHLEQTDSYLRTVSDFLSELER